MHNISTLYGPLWYNSNHDYQKVKKKISFNETVDKHSFVYTQHNCHIYSYWNKL